MVDLSILSFPNESELLSQILADIENNLGLKIADNPGSIARAMVEAYNKQISNVYGSLNLSLTSRFLSTATGSDLDMIGRLLSCYRLNPSETDENFRYRISQQVFTAANSNRTAVTLQALSIPGVKNVKIDEFGAGNGSFILYVLTDELIPSFDLLEEVRQKINNEVKAFGIKSIIKAPELVQISIEVTAKQKQSSNIPQNVIKEILTKSVSDILDEVDMGQTVSYNQLATTLQSAINNVDVDILKISIDNKELISTSMLSIPEYSRPYLSNLVVVKND